MALQAVKQFRTRQLAAALKTDTTKVSQKTPKVSNPFLPHKNPDTGRWAPPRYSLRQQADLVKKAKATNTLYLLPPGPKLSLSELQKASKPAPVGETSSEEAWTQDIAWEGEVKEKKIDVSGHLVRMYAGRKRMFKGHKWERTKEKREKKRGILMKSMPARIQRFKAVYRRRRPSPLSRPLTGKSTKLPF